MSQNTKYIYVETTENTVTYRVRTPETWSISLNARRFTLADAIRVRDVALEEGYSAAVKLRGEIYLEKARRAVKLGVFR